MKIVADPNIPFVQEAFGLLGEVRLVPGREITANAARDADVLLVRSVTPVNAALLDGSRVKFVATATIGTDHVDEDDLRQKGIGFASAQGSNANSVAEYVVAALLEIAQRQKFRLRDKTLGVVGVGNVGARVVRYAEALGMRVLQNDPPRQRAERLKDFFPIEQVLAEADVISLHVPLTKAGAYPTYHMFAKDTLSVLEDRLPILINSARGAVIDNKAMLKAIDGDKLGGAVLDVWENEPGISPELLDVVDIGTPHIAGYSLDGKVNGVAMIHKAVCRFLGVTSEWHPEIPPPAQKRVVMRCHLGDDDEDVLRTVIEGVYNVSADDAGLRANVTQFDKLRAEYPVRREFFNFGLTLPGASDELQRKFTALGFVSG
ncbi:MAG TPA: 4-phosphoerythronate dehydrogenase PdxB [Verrucomicrobiae bacterium]|nr:4-phosphoerythronate dehydrogenase PdxB [Verrucomicrobiae bacterium]